MEILEIPFHKFLGIRKHKGKDYIFEANEKPEYLNHLGTIHACAQLTIAEASSGEFLLKEFGSLKSKVIPVVRKTNAKYHQPAKGKLFAKAAFYSSNKTDIIKELENKNRVLVKIKVELFNQIEDKILTVIFDWFIKKITSTNETSTNK